MPARHGFRNERLRRGRRAAADPGRAGDAHSNSHPDSDANPDADPDPDSDPHPDARHRPTTTRRNIRPRNIRSFPMPSPPTMPARPARASRSVSSTAASIRRSTSSPAASTRRAATSPAAAASATRAATARRSARSLRRRATVAERWASRSTRRSSANAPIRPGSCATTGTDGGCKFFDGAIAAGIDAARNAGAKVINMSLGGSDPRQSAARGDAARGQCRHRAGHLGGQRRHRPDQGHRSGPVRADSGAECSRVR